MDLILRQMIDHFCTKKAVINEAKETPAAIFLSSLPYTQAPTHSPAARLDKAIF